MRLLLGVRWRDKHLLSHLNRTYPHHEKWSQSTGKSRSKWVRQFPIFRKVGTCQTQPKQLFTFVMETGNIRETGHHRPRIDRP